MTRTAAVLVLALFAGGCVFWPHPPGSVPTGTLLSIETRGGMCVDGPCGTTILVERDGRVHQAALPPNDLGVVQPAALAALNLAIRTTNFVDLKSHAFTGQCPTAYDGVELVFEFGAPDGVQRVASCEVEIAYGSPLFVAVAAAVGHFMSFPIY